MDLTSLNFFGFAIVGLVAIHLSNARVYRAGVLGLLNVVFIASYVDDWRALLPLAAFLAMGFVAVVDVRQRPSGRVAAGWVVAIVAVFVVLKRFSFLGELPTLPFPYLLVGLSYVLFRVLHMVWEAPHVSSGERPGVLEYFNYTCNFLTFISGPIQRFDDFRQSMRAGPLDSAAVAGAFGRIAAGLFKVLVVSAGANAAFLALEPVILGPSPSGGGATFVALYAATATAFTLYLYFNFSGYMDIVIGVGRLFGQTLPGNFNRPFTAQSFLDFWARWHITLSDWFKLYLFNPLLKALVGRFPDPRWSAGLGVVAFFVTFLVMGIWHGTTVVFVIYGLTMGAGASINKLWQIGLTRALGRPGYRRLGERALYAYACRGITFAYFALGVTCLWVDMEQLAGLAARLGVLGWPVACFALAVAAAAATWVLDRIEVLYTSVRASAAGLVESFAMRNAWLGAQIVTIAIVASFFHKSPEFVYKAF